MLEKEKIKQLIKTYLPQAGDDTVANIADDIAADIEARIYSMVRQAVNQERENLYLRNKAMLR